VAYLNVEWQIYSRLDRKIVLTLTTEGSVEQKKSTRGGLDDALADAFSMAVRNLLGEKQFFDLAVSSTELKMEGKSTAIKLTPPSTTGSTIGEIANIKSAVVTLFAGDSMGSGFIVSEDGYILSNQHVVGDARYVRIKFSSGIEVNGEVVSLNRARDVALIKCGEQGLKCLPIRRELPGAGEDVYAIGTPLKENLNQTITKGIVSGYRSIENLNYIQSDVAINPGNSGGPLMDTSGNVVGIAVLKRADAESLGFFVPINDALLALEIK
jgi:S1-C subfamily serine protease